MNKENKKLISSDTHKRMYSRINLSNVTTPINKYIHFIFIQVSRCCGLKITSEGYVVTLAKNNHHVLVLNTLYIQ